MDPNQAKAAFGDFTDDAVQDIPTYQGQQHGAMHAHGDPYAAQRQKLFGFHSTRVALDSTGCFAAAATTAGGEPDVDLSVPVVFAQASSSHLYATKLDTTTTATVMGKEPHQKLSTYPYTAVMPSLTPKDDCLNKTQESRLREEYGFPLGLSQAVKQNLRKCPIRFWIVDNSGSMYESDGHVLRGQGHNRQLVPCTRWAEMQATVTAHAELSGLLEASTVFCLLNDPSDPNLPQRFSVAENYDVGGRAAKVPHQIQSAKTIMKKVEPDGVTPLTIRLLEIYERILAIEEPLRQHGQRAVVVLATDGMPTDELGDASPEVALEFVHMLQQLQRLPVWIVVRLCTDDAETVNFYNDLDKKLELPLEVIDDFLAEGSEIHVHNPWLNYGLQLHRVREMGFQNRILDLLDERTLTKDEVRELLELLFGNTTLELQKAPDVHAEWKGFCRAIKALVQGQGRVWCPRTRRMEPWINMKALQRAYGDCRSGGCWSCFGG